MITEFVNGYNVTGNHGVGAAREYHVRNAAGKVLGTAPGKVLAMAVATEMPTGNVPEPEDEPEPEAEPDVVVEEAPEPEVEPEPKPEP